MVRHSIFTGIHLQAFDQGSFFQTAFGNEQDSMNKQKDFLEKLSIVCLNLVISHYVSMVIPLRLNHSTFSTGPGHRFFINALKHDVSTHTVFS